MNRFQVVTQFSSMFAMSLKYLSGKQPLTINFCFSIDHYIKILIMMIVIFIQSQLNDLFVFPNITIGILYQMNCHSYFLHLFVPICCVDFHIIVLLHNALSSLVAQQYVCKPKNQLLNRKTAMKGKHPIKVIPIRVVSNVE